MHESDRLLNRIDKIDRAAIRNVDAEANAALVRDQPITRIEAGIVRDRRIDDGDTVTVNLLSRDERRFANPELVPHLAMNAIETTKRFRFVRADVNASDARGE